MLQTREPFYHSITILVLAALAALPACALDDRGGEPAYEIDEVSAELTTPVSGAVAKPSSWTIRPPWGAGVQHRITNGYGSGMHQHVSSPGNANDHYALDFNMSLNEAVYPIADGAVIFAGTATGGWSAYGKIVFIEHLVNGVKYHSMYAHLNQIYVGVGPISRDTALGGAGGTGGWPVHLHLAVYKNASFQNTAGGKGPYGGQAMVPEAFAACVKNGALSCENLAYNNQLQRTNEATCGSACAQCVLTARPDVLAFYEMNGWDTSCGNRDNIVNNWCGIDPSGCSAVKNGTCASVCSTNPYPACSCTVSDNYCNHGPQTPGCPMTFPGGYCDPNGNTGYEDADWVRGYNEYQSYCH
jgi:hypothetical protein